MNLNPLMTLGFLRFPPSLHLKYLCLPLAKRGTVLLFVVSPSFQDFIHWLMFTISHQGPKESFPSVCLFYFFILETQDRELS